MMRGQVQLDTGSSDLWLDPTVAGMTLDGLVDTGFNATVQYLYVLDRD